MPESFERLAWGAVGLNPALYRVRLSVAAVAYRISVK